MRLAVLCASVMLLAPFCLGQSGGSENSSPALGSVRSATLSAHANGSNPFPGGGTVPEINALVGSVRHLLLAPTPSLSPGIGKASATNDPFPISNVIYMDGCANVAYPVYNCNSAGVQQAMHDANGHAGVTGVVVIPPTVNCLPAWCPQMAVQMNSTPISMPSFTYIIGYGKYASEFDYSGAGCAFDFPAGTVFSGLIGIGLEQENLANSGICMEGSPTAQTINNVISDVYVANNVIQNGFVSGQKGIVITSTPGGGNGTAIIRNNIFRDVLVLGLNQPVVANASTQNRWDIKIQGVGPSQAAMNLCGVSDVVDVSVEDYGGAQANTVAFGNPSATCTNNQVRLVANLIGSGAKMLNDLGNGDEIHVSDTNASGIGNPSPTGFTVYCGPLAPYCMEILPQVSFANLPASVPNGSSIICTDCLNSSRCGTGGSGALAKRIAGQWVCH